MYIGQWHFSPLQIRHLGIPYSPNCRQQPQCIFLNLTDSLKSLPFCFLKICIYLFIFRERGKEGERGRETSMHGSQPRHVPWLGIKLATLWFAGRCSIYWATPARAEISSFLKVILVLGKARSPRAPNLGCWGSWVTWVIWCFAKDSARDVTHEQVRCPDEAANHQLSIAAAFWII